MTEQYNIVTCTNCDHLDRYTICFCKCHRDKVLLRATNGIDETIAEVDKRYTNSE